jgi:HK97 family phage major capsid protein
MSEAENIIEFPKGDVFHAEHKQLFENWVRSPTAYKERLEEFENRYFEGKQVDLGTGAAGAFAQPLEVRNRAQQIADNVNTARMLSPVVMANSMDYRAALIDDGTGASWVGETDARTVSATGAFRGQVPTFGELVARPAITEWALDDLVDSTEWLLMTTESQFALIETKAFISGTGVNQPSGMLLNAPLATADSTRDVNTYQFTAVGAAGSISLASLGGLQMSLPDYVLAQPQNAAWLMHPLIWAEILGLDAYISPATRNGAIATFMGMNVFISAQMPAPGVGSFSLAVGDFAQGYILLERFPGTRYTNDNVTDKGKINIYSRRRIGGQVLNNRAIRFGQLS